MFQLPDVRGILVENALPELVNGLVDRRFYTARSPMADGVIEGLQHFGVLPGELRVEPPSCAQTPRQ
jgi:hypothetical protein